MSDPYRPLLERAAQMFGVRVADIFAPIRTEDAMLCRRAVYLALTRKGLTSEVIAEMTCRERSTISKVLVHARKLEQSNWLFAARVQALVTGAKAPDSQTFGDVLQQMADLISVSVQSLLQGTDKVSRNAAICIAHDSGVTVGSMAKALGRTRGAIVERLRNSRKHERVQALIAIYHRTYDTRKAA